MPWKNGYLMPLRGRVYRRLTVWCLKAVFNSIQLYHGDQFTYPCFIGVLLTSTPHNIFTSHWLFSHMTIVETMDSSKRGMGPVAMARSSIHGMNIGRAED